jgi:hypothetical protein
MDSAGSPVSDEPDGSVGETEGQAEQRGTKSMIGMSKSFQFEVPVGGRSRPVREMVKIHLGQMPGRTKLNGNGGGSTRAAA